MHRRNLAVCLSASLGIATAAGVVTALPASAADCTSSASRTPSGSWMLIFSGRCAEGVTRHAAGNANGTNG